MNAELKIDGVYSIWKTGYSIHTALGVLLVDQSERAYKFKVLNSNKEYTFYMPKRALRIDPTNDGILELARWFKIEGFLSWVFNTYANHYRR